MLMKTLRIMCLVGFALVIAVGCMTVDLQTEADKPVMMSGEVDNEYSIVRSFEVDHKAWFTLFDLVTVKNPSVGQTIERELKRADGDAAINVEIVGQTTFIDGLIPVAMTVAGTLVGTALAPDPYYGSVYGTIVGSVTGAMLSARTYTVKGDIIKYRQ